jgi:hypothetical protein
LSTPWRKISGFGKKSDLCNTLLRRMGYYYGSSTTRL